MRLPSIGSLSAVRLLAVATLVIFAAQLVVLTTFWTIQRRSGQSVFDLPLPAAVAAMVELLDAADADERERLLTALSSGRTHVYFSTVRLQGEPANGLRVQTLRNSLNLYSEALKGREVIAMVAMPDGGMEEPVSTPTGLRASYPMRLVIAMADGEWLVIETPSLMEARFLRTPVGLFAGLFGLVIASAALWNVWNVVRPARDMARAARAFGETGLPQHVRSGGGADMRGLVEAFNALQDKVAALLAGRTLVMSAMSHDVRTYLTRLRLRIEALEPSSRDAAERAINDIQALLDDTLAFAEAETDEEGAETVDVSGLVRAIAASGQFDPARLSVSAPVVAVVRGKAGRLERALVNLVSNALKYGERAEIAVFREAGSVTITITDHGPGIPEADRRRVFEPFYRRDASRNRGVEGAGLGLAIARSVIERHGGTITLGDRADGPGLRVSVSLPAMA